MLTPQSWTLSVDTAGPFLRRHDGHTKSTRYLVVGVLTVPKVSPTNPAEPRVDVPDVENSEPPVEEVMEDAEWLSQGEPKNEAKPAPSAREGI